MKKISFLANVKYCLLIFYVCCQALVFAILLTGCEKDIDLNLPDYQTKLVVEGTIENGLVPMVVLTKSIPYFSNIIADSLLGKFFINNAIVTVTSNSGVCDTLTFTLDAAAPLFFCYKGHFPAIENETYTLKIYHEEKIYTAKTTILSHFELDSIGFNRINDSISTIRVAMTDNASTKDYYQFCCKVRRGSKLSDRLWVSAMPLAFDDGTFNGLTFNYEVLRLHPSTILSSGLSEEERRSFSRPYFKQGDTVYVRHSKIDYQSYRFWSTISNEYSFGQNAFFSPPPVQSNITCNTGEAVLGSWIGYAAKIDTLIYR